MNWASASGTSMDRADDPAAPGASFMASSGGAGPTRRSMRGPRDSISPSAENPRQTVDSIPLSSALTISGGSHREVVLVAQVGEPSPHPAVHGLGPENRLVGECPLLREQDEGRRLGSTPPAASTAQLS